MVWKQFYSIKKKLPTFCDKKPFMNLGRELRIKSTIVCLLSKHEQKEQVPQEHLISLSISDENEALMESISTQSLLPYEVEHEEDGRDVSTTVICPLTAMIVTN
jgi:hypothetical protein